MLLICKSIAASDMDDYDWLSHSTMRICERATFMIESLALER